MNEQPVPRSADERKTLLDAPVHYTSNEASIWAIGYNTALLALNPPPEPTDEEKRELLRKALSKEVFARQRELSVVNADYKALGIRRATLISQVAAAQLKLTEFHQEEADSHD